MQTSHRQVTYRLQPRKTSAWRGLERVLEEQRQLCNAALQERVDCWRKTGEILTWKDQFRNLTSCRHEIPGTPARPVQRAGRLTPDRAGHGTGFTAWAAVTPITPT
ncbi:MAG: hypothetical protein OXE86_04290 [Alphaproteobacteria bacterium]|nr:hypothetical protein [Alphaproteobacteria bacterium]